jgi:hypothetical protein
MELQPSTFYLDYTYGNNVGMQQVLNQLKGAVFICIHRWSITPYELLQAGVRSGSLATGGMWAILVGNAVLQGSSLLRKPFQLLMPISVHGAQQAQPDGSRHRCNSSRVSLASMHATLQLRW